MVLTRVLPPACAVALLWACAAQPAPKTAAVQPVAVAESNSARTLSPLRLNFGTSCGITGMREAVLQRVNAVRASGASCGRQRMPPVPGLQWNDILFTAAARHSGDMARRNYFEHATPEGKRVGARVTEEGYSWRAIGENIAGGDRTVEGVMRGWMASDGHCRNVMNPDYNDIGVACVERSGSTWGTHWTMVLGRRR